jgi:AcrR family transcriptional regulator
MVNSDILPIFFVTFSITLSLRTTSIPSMGKTSKRTPDRFLDSATDLDKTKRDILQAVYRSLLKNGYPNTTMSEIAAELDKSKSLLYYHYDDKEDLLNDFFIYICKHLEKTLLEGEHDDPETQLYVLIDRLLPMHMEKERMQFRRILFEIRSQAPHNVSYHNQLQRTDEIFIASLKDTIVWGIETGRFKQVDPQQQAELLFATVYGILERGVTLEDPELMNRNRTALQNQIDLLLLNSERKGTKHS